MSQIEDTQKTDRTQEYINGMGAMMSKFAKNLGQSLFNVDSDNGKETVSYSTFSKQEILTYLKRPTAASNAKNLRLASRQMFQNSNQYGRLVLYHALLPTWAYVVLPKEYPGDVSNKLENYQKSYYQALKNIDAMHIRHEMFKAFIHILVDGVLFGVVRKDNSSNWNTWFVQAIDPSICTLSSIVDGTFMYAVDMSRIKEEDLYKYPNEFTKMYRKYQSSGIKQQVVPEEISFCLVADESKTYTVPPLASSLPSIFDLEAFNEMADIGDAINNYKLINMQIPTDSNGEPTMGWDLASRYYKQLEQVVPEFVAVGMSPTKLTSIDFNPKTTSTNTELNEALSKFWFDSGTSPLLFGDATNKSATALEKSIKADEEPILALMAQAERVLNRHISYLSGSTKFKVKILPITIFNQKDMISTYKEAATLGLPTKLYYAAAIGESPLDLSNSMFVENTLLDLSSNFSPLSSTYTQTSEDSAGGRPEVDDDELSESGEQTRNNEGNVK